MFNLNMGTIRGVSAIHILLVVALSWKKLEYNGDRGDIPYQRYGHTAVVLNGSCIIYGGRNDVDGVSEHVYRFDVGTYPGLEEREWLCDRSGSDEKEMVLERKRPSIMPLPHQRVR